MSDNPEQIKGAATEVTNKNNHTQHIHNEEKSKHNEYDKAGF